MTNEHSLNKDALVAARKRVMLPHNLAPATVTYSTYGHLLIMGSEDMIRLAAEQLSGMASITLLATDSVENQNEEHLEKALNAAQEITVYHSKLQTIKGFLGQFQVTTEQNGQSENFAKITQNRVHFDLILNLGQKNHFVTELAPTGYFNVAPGSDKLASIIEELPSYIGEFEKPRYFQINTDICAHSSRGQTGCTRCLDVCPADAISSEKDLININPHLCHGAGGCVTACPTGAINYALPQPAHMHSYLQKLLSAYKEFGGSEPVILFHDHEEGLEIVERLSDTLPSNFIPVQLEELAAAGQETWLTCLASGAQQVLLLKTESLPEVVNALLEKEVSITQKILEGLQYKEEQLILIDELEIANFSAPSGVPQITTIDLIDTHNKRDTLFTALDHLIAQNNLENTDHLALPAGSPFGQIAVNNTSCTLCMSCVAVCPTQSLTDGGEKPALNFKEQNCVQCGLCEGACPEKAITLVPRLSLSEQRNTSVEIYSEEPFECISCSKPFAPKSTVEKMIEKLSAHPYFQGPAINRLKMCEDCRVNDIFTDLTANPEKQLEL
jgi:ferredoxin